MILTHLVLFNFFHGASAGGAVPEPPPVVVQRNTNGVKRKPYRVRRSDFSSEENYKLALKAALAGVYVVTAPIKEPEAKPEKVKKFRVKPQIKTQIDDSKLIAAFIKAIESEYE